MNDSEQVHDLWQRSNLAEHEGDNDVALSLLEAANRLDWQRHHTLYLMARLLLRMGNFETASNAATESLHLKSDYPPALFTEGTILSRWGDKIDDRDKIVLSIEKFNSFPEAARVGSVVGEREREMGCSYAALGDNRKAGEHFLKAVEHNPDDVWTWYALGRLYMQEKKYRAALPALERAYRLNPDDADLVYDRSYVLYKTGAPPDVVIQELERCVALKPENEKFVTALAAMKAWFGKH